MMIPRRTPEKDKYRCVELGGRDSIPDGIEPDEGHENASYLDSPVNGLCQ